MDLSRRQFLRMSGYGIGAAGCATLMHRLNMSTALAQGTDYRALVCVFLFGGNDGNNTVIPYDGYNDPGGYAAVRTASTLAIPKANLLPIATSYGTYGLHPKLPDVQNLYNQGKVAIICNAGPLVKPLTKPEYQMSSSPKPYS